jgi:hypothetical protein
MEDIARNIKKSMIAGRGNLSYFIPDGGLSLLSQCVRNHYDEQ